MNTCEKVNNYKLNQLKKVLDSGNKNGYYGKLLPRSGEAKFINIDKGAIEALIRYYENNVDE